MPRPTQPGGCKRDSHYKFERHEKEPSQKASRTSEGSIMKEPGSAGEHAGSSGVSQSTTAAHSQTAPKEPEPQPVPIPEHVKLCAMALLSTAEQAGAIHAVSNGRPCIRIDAAQRKIVVCRVTEDERRAAGPVNEPPSAPPASFSK